MNTRPGLPLTSAVKGEAVLALDRGDAVEAGDGGRREDGEPDGVLQPVLVTHCPALVLPLVRQAEEQVNISSTLQQEVGGIEEVLSLSKKANLISLHA